MLIVVKLQSLPSISTHHLSTPTKNIFYYNFVPLLNYLKERKVLSRCTLQILTKPTSPPIRQLPNTFGGLKQIFKRGHLIFIINFINYYNF